MASYVFFCLYFWFDPWRLQYELALVASDSLNENETTVVIRINDKNDLPPVFSQPMYTSQIEEEYSAVLPLKLLKVNYAGAVVSSHNYPTFPIPPVTSGSIRVSDVAILGNGK